MKSVILVTGAGTGIGKLTAQALAEAGHIVYASMRDITGRNRERADAVRALAERESIDLRPIELDVLSQASADAAAAQIVQAHGRIDVVVQNAGHLVIGPTEAFVPEEMMKVFDTNVFGAQRVNRAVLPYMRKAESGLVVWISSTTTKGGFPPFMGPYGAAKAAMDSLAVTLAYELVRFGIETSIVVPGAFTSGTDHFPNAGKPADTTTAAAYARYDGVMDQVGAKLNTLMPPDADPIAVAEDVVRIVGLDKGTRPMRSVTDFINDGAAEVLEVSERVRIEFAKRIGLGDLLEVKTEVSNP
ncbi:Oxidoreductase [Pararobbsia alpina]|uniref:SDR family oxidoreductase n=1 Tax=Pararobbsia alpina TaxID=621374 RepID=UPI0039A45EF4